MELRLEAWGLPPCKSEQYYELWLVEGDERVSAGSFTVGESGRVDVTLNAPNFAASSQVGVTAEYDKDPAPATRRCYRASCTICDSSFRKLALVRQGFTRKLKC